MAFAAMGSTCVKCGKHIHHRIEPTGRTFPAGIEISDGVYYEHLKGELCEACDKETPLEEKSPVMAEVFKRLGERLKKKAEALR